MKIKLVQAALFATLLVACETSGDKKLPREKQQETFPQTPASTFEHMQELNWLAGNSVDRNRPFVTTNTISWNSGKTMLIEHFSIKLAGKKFDGQQIIAWDPALKKIRSWIFDSDGGIGESFWSKQENSWLAITTFTLPDGSKASAMHVYTKIDDNSYTFSSENRDIDGNLLPNIGPFKFVREK